VSFELYPAIDVRGGAVVRLRQGDYARETRYPGEPLALAARHAGDGARWLHLVDLDAAREGGYGLAGLLSAIKDATPLRVQTGGGVRSADDVAAMLAAGADRVVVGSLAVRDPGLACEWLQRFGPERLVFALDMRRDDAGRWRLPSHGWTTDSEADPAALLDLFARHGLRHLLCTDISRDGMLGGPNLPLYRWALARAPRVLLQASGGVRDAADLRAAREAGCAGAVVGKALLDGLCPLREALDEVAAC
jgi:phosphoribosylformimino-5-aminoimidazole carboxamide ribotide isomerase